MAGNFALDTATHPGLSQVLFAFSDGSLYDHKAQQASGKVAVTDARKQAAARQIKRNGLPVLTET